MDPSDCRWEHVKSGRIFDTVQKDPEGWKEKQAKEYARRLAKTFGKKLATNPELTARAIQLYSEKLAASLHERLCSAPDEADDWE
jgi:hypothetical protein